MSSSEIPITVVCARVVIFTTNPIMKLRNLLPISQNEFGFTPNTFNLFGDCTSDGERIVREREQAEKTRQLAEMAQTALFQTER